MPQGRPQPAVLVNDQARARTMLPGGCAQPFPVRVTAVPALAADALHQGVAPAGEGVRVHQGRLAVGELCAYCMTDFSHPEPTASKYAGRRLRVE